MKMKTLAGFCAMAAFLGACEKYTEKTSTCFGRNGEPTVTRAALSFAVSDSASNAAIKDCAFEDLPRPK